MDYIHHKNPAKPEPFMPEKYKTPEGEIDTVTSYAKDFICRLKILLDFIPRFILFIFFSHLKDKYSEKTQPIKPNNLRKDLGKFEADPTYKCK